MDGGMSKSAVPVAREALAAGRAALPEDAGPHSRKDEAQPQLLALLALLALRQFLRTGYRGSVITVAERAGLRRAPGLAKVPRSSALAQASRRSPADAEAGRPFSTLGPPWPGVRGTAA